MRGHPAQGGQVGPLVVVPFEGLQVQEDRGAVVPGGLEQRGGDQVADPAGRQQVLGREQPVVTGQGHPPAQRHRLAQQPASQPAGQLGRDRGGEEHPGVRPDPGPGDLKGNRDLQGAACLDVHQRVEHRLRAIEVGGQPPAPVAIQQRVQPDVDLALQVRGQHRRGQRQVAAVLVPDTLLPASAHRRDPPGLPRALVVVPNRVQVRPRGEQRAKERHLRLLRRTVMHDPWRCLEEGGLSRHRRGGLLRRQPQQLKQPGVLRPQPGQLSLNRHRILSHEEHATGARQGGSRQFRLRPSMAPFRMFMQRTKGGRIVLIASASRAGKSWTAHGTPRRERGLKHGADHETRTIPIRPGLVNCCAPTSSGTAPPPDGRIFQTARGAPSAFRTPTRTR